MSWTLTRYDEKYAINPNADKACVLIPGWGVGSDIFEWLLPALAQDFVVYLADASSYTDMTTPTSAAAQLQPLIADQVTQPCWLLGWSLGGNIALQVAMDFPEQVQALVLYACSPSFIARDHWPKAMAQKTFDQFVAGVEANAAKTLKRFDLLQAKGDGEQKKLQHSLSEYRAQQAVLSAPELLAGLQLLAAFDQVEALASIHLPVLWLLGEKDQLVDVSILAELKTAMPQAQVYELADTSHLPFLTATDACFVALKKLLARVQRQQEKQKIAASFSNAAASYDAAAALQKSVAENVLAMLPKASAMTVLDAGSGTGYWSNRIAEEKQSVIALDMAQGMLAYAKGHSQLDNIRYCGGDLEQLPLASNSIDAVFSSLAVQWCDSIERLLAEWVRVLKPGGQICLATLGPKTLFELRQSFQAADDGEHVNQFLAADVLCDQIATSDLELLQLKCENKVMRYETMRELMADLKNIGAQTVLSQGGGQVKTGLMGKQRFSKAQAAYDAFRDAAGLLPATYEVIYLQLQKPLNAHCNKGPDYG